MKKIIMIFITVLCLCIGVTAYAESEIMKISMDGEVKQAKDIGSGKGISFTLPDYDETDYFISSIELAVFEKQDGESNYHIYKDNNGNESKKQLLKNPESLNIQVDFGDTSDYRDKAKYKIGYRYYLTSTADMSIITIAGEDIKNGWRLVGEANGGSATDDGFRFYKNANPTFNIECFSYIKHSSDGEVTADCAPSDVESTPFPMDLFTNGMTVQMKYEDFDQEDIVIAHYYLYDADTNQLIADGYLPATNIITADVGDAKNIKLQLEVSDNFGGKTETQEYVFTLDKEAAAVTSEFNDGGYWLRGKILFSDFYINDDADEKMTNGQVAARILKDGSEYKRVILSQNTDGVYRLYETNMPDGRYTVQLALYDKAGNVSTHTFYQNLDNTAPTAEFLTPEQYSSATLYSTWMNVSKTIAMDLKDASSGVKYYYVYRNNALDSSTSYGTAGSPKRATRSVTTSYTGKITYRISIYDAAKTINMSANTYSSGSGNSASYTKYVWLDKTKPTITTDHSESVWYEAPYTMTASFNDYPSSSSVADASGIKQKQYAITETSELPSSWNTYTSGIEFTTGGVWYVHLKAVDYAGNETIKVYKVKINTKPQIMGIVRPTDDYMHTIYYSDSQFYVIKSTAYNTKYHYSIADEDINDVIKTSVKLVNADNSSCYATADVTTQSTGEVTRDVVFNMPYVDALGDQLPDGVYNMYLNIKDIKNDGEELTAYTNYYGCQVIIKRNAPPTPIISVSGGKVSIEYPTETLADSLNMNVVRQHYKKEYKTVIEGDGTSNIYRTYQNPFDAKKMVVTALYTDIAGNTSTATKRIFDTGSTDGEGDTDIITPGNTTVVEESRSANVYYIGIRREKTSDLNGNIFDFME